MKKLMLYTGLIGILLAGCATSSKSISKEKEASAHYKLGVSYLNDGGLQAAFLEFEKAIAINPNDKLSHYYLGHVYFLQKNNPEALKEFNRVIQIDPDYSDAYNYSGIVYETMGNLDLALKNYHLALKNKLYEKPHYIHLNIGRIYLAQNRLKEAITEYLEAIHIEPGYALAYRALGEAYLKTGDEKSALDSFVEAVQLSPEDPMNHFRLAEMYWKEKSYQKGEIEFKKVISLVPDSDLAKEAKNKIEGRK
ncbi:MAG: tetratricopeptide repeat protein [Nitrospiria bacterium]